MFLILWAMGPGWTSAYSTSQTRSVPLISSLCLMKCEGMAMEYMKPCPSVSGLSIKIVVLPPFDPYLSSKLLKTSMSDYQEGP
jgi:hypothetical protein